MKFKEGILCVKELVQEKARPAQGTQRNPTLLEERMGKEQDPEAIVVQILQGLIIQMREFRLLCLLK